MLRTGRNCRLKSKGRNRGIPMLNTISMGDSMCMVTSI